MNTIEKIAWAREVLNIPKRATIDVIKQNFKQLQKKWHPDLCQEDSSHCHEMTIKINEAYKMLMTYIERYEFSFAEEEVKKYCTAEEWWNNRFGDGPVWKK
jgi:DnaJ-class molecular chaperone